MNVIENYKYEEAVELLSRLPENLGTVYDLGAGKRDSPVSLQIKKLKCGHLISVEPFQPYIEFLLHGGNSADVHDVVSAHLTHSNFKVGACDLVLLIDVIEHLDKKGAIELLAHLQRKAKNIVIFAPEGDTVGYTNSDMGNPLQEHKSAWIGEEFESLGFDVTVYRKFHAHLGDVSAMWAIWKTPNG